MSSHLKHEQVAGSVFDHWSNQFPLVVTTIYPGMKVDTVAINEWLELRLDLWSQRPQRSGSLEIIDFRLTVECFVKQGVDKSRIQELVDATRETVFRQTIAIRDYEASGSPVTGYARFLETDTRDLSRSDVSTFQHTMQHFRMFCPGIAEQI